MRAPWATHFGFTKLPFSKTVAAKDLLDRASHQEAIARMRFCIAEALLGVITGEVGVGKTVAVRAAISQLDQAAHHIVYLANPTVGTRGLYVNIVQALGAIGDAAAVASFVTAYREAGVTLPAIRPIGFPDAPHYRPTLEACAGL